MLVDELLLLVRDEIRELSAAAAQCRDPVRRKVLRISARNARGEFDASRRALSIGNIVQRPVVTKLCEKCYDYKIEMSEVQAERVRYQRGRGDSLITRQGRRIRITIDSVLRARGKMMKSKANGPADCLVTEMLQVLPMETVYEVTHWFRGECRAPGAWKILRLVFFSRTLTPVEKGLRGFRAIALLSGFSKMFSAVLVDLLQGGEGAD